MTDEVAVSLRSVSRSFVDGTGEVEALRSVSLDVPTEAMVAIQGPSGSGKSTLLNIVGLLDVPTSGEVTIDGAATSTLSEADRTRLRGAEIGFVFQSFHLLNDLNVIDNVALGMFYSIRSRQARYAEAYRVLHRVGLGHRLTASPTTLSGGERQRVAIARAIVGKRRLLLCDEPTGNLDTDNTAAFLSTLRGMMEEGLTVIVATHDPQVAEFADRAIRVVDGRIEGDAA